jgi:GDP-mannose 6-dehydrogenase
LLLSRPLSFRYLYRFSVLGGADAKMLDAISRSPLINESQTARTIAVFGLGYVGAVSAACLAHNGYSVIGVDPNRTKVDLINNGMPPIIEQDLAELICGARQQQNLRAISDPSEAIAESSISLVCVGTPSLANGDLDLQGIERVCVEIGTALRKSRAYHVVVIRSTILPGSMAGVIRPTLERTSKKLAGIDFGLANNPEFLREGSAVRDFFEPPKIVIGASDDRSRRAVAGLYDALTAPVFHTSVEIAEMIKYVDNSWHALKVAFGNEIGNICGALEIDSRRVMEIFCQDTKLNISSAYLRPGFAFGGSCLPKDLRALTYKARRIDLSLPVLESILPSNRTQIERAIRLISNQHRRRVGVLGFSFKAGTDDLRESPIVELIEQMIGKGYEVRLYDRNVQLAQLVGANRDHILNAIPHIARLMVDNAREVLDHADLILIGTNDAGYSDIEIHLSPDQIVIDLAGVGEFKSGQYNGINW